MKKIAKNKWWYFFLVFMFSISSYIASASSAAPSPEAPSPSPQIDFPPRLKLGGHDWKLGYSADGNNSQIAEYVTHDENVNSWTQLITYQRLKFEVKKELTPAAFAQIEMEQLKSNGFIAKSAIIDANPQEAIFEFRVSAPKVEQQDELQRIIKTADNKIIVLHYVIKKTDMGQAERSKWIGILRNIAVPSFANVPKN